MISNWEHSGVYLHIITCPTCRVRFNDGVMGDYFEEHPSSVEPEIKKFYKYCGCCGCEHVFIDERIENDYRSHLLPKMVKDFMRCLGNEPDWCDEYDAYDEFLSWLSGNIDDYKNVDNFTGVSCTYIPSMKEFIEQIEGKRDDSEH